MKKSKLVITLFIAIAFVFAGFSAYATSDEQITQENEATRLYEMEDLRTLSGKAYAMSDGAITYDLYAANIHYEDEAGQLKEINSSIINIDGAKNGGYKYKNAENSWDVYFADNTNNEIVKMAKGEHEIEISFITDKGKAIAKKNTEINKSKSELHEKYFEDTSAVFYENIKSDIDIAYSVREGYVKEDIILNSIPSSNTFEFIINANNLDIVLKNNRLEFIDKKNKEVVFVSQKLIMYDSAYKTSEDLSMNLELAAEDTYKLTIIADETFLKNNETVYPVVIDPTIIMDGSDVVKDTYVSSVNPSSHYYSSDYLRTGNDGAGSLGVRRTFIEFDIPSTIDNNTIYQANLEMLVRTYDGSITTRAYIITEDDWGVTGTDWDDQPETTNDYRSSPCTFFPYSGTGTDWMTMNVTSIVSRWANGTYNNNGFMVKDDVETSSSIWATMYSSNYGTTYKRPRLTITYYPSTVDYNKEMAGMYGGNYSDSDIEDFKDELVDNYGYVDARYSYLDTNPERLIEADKYDVLIWSGHGYSYDSSAWLSYGLQTSSSTPSAGSNYTFDAINEVGCTWQSGTVYSNSVWDGDLDYVFITSCNQLTTSTQRLKWARAMCGRYNRVRIFHGYSYTGPGDGIDNYQVDKYFYYADTLNERSITAWDSANDAVNTHYTTSYNTTVVAFYDALDDDLLGIGSTQASSSTLLASTNLRYLSGGSGSGDAISVASKSANVAVDSKIPVVICNTKYSGYDSIVFREMDIYGEIEIEKDDTKVVADSYVTKLENKNDLDVTLRYTMTMQQIPVVEGNTAKYPITTYGIKYVYVPSYEGIEFSARPGGNNLTVYCDEKGVYKANNMLLDIIKSESEAIVKYTIEDAVKLCEKYGLDTKKIIDERLVYSNTISKSESEFRPVWEIVYDSTVIQIDVETGELYDYCPPR